MKLIITDDRDNHITEFDVDMQDESIEFEIDLENAEFVVAMLRDCADAAEEYFNESLN